MIKLIDILKESLLAEYNKSQLDYISSKLGIERNSEFDSLMNALDAQGIKYPELKDKIIKGEIKSFNDLKSLKTQSKSDVTKAIKSNSRVVYEDDNFFIVVPYTHAASCYYGAGTKWCTTDKDVQYWVGYIKDTKITLYYIINKNLSQSSNLYKVAIVVDPRGKITQAYNAEDKPIDFNKYFERIRKTKGIYLPDVVDFRSLSSDIISSTDKEVTSICDKTIKNYTKGNFILSGCPFTSLPNGLNITGDIAISNSKITSLPEDIKVEGNFYIENTPLKSFPENLKKINGFLELINTKIKFLPDDLKIKGNLLITSAKIKFLPNGLEVDGFMSINDTLISDLPKDIKVNGDVLLGNSPLCEKYSKEQIRKMFPGIKGRIYLRK